MLVNIGGYYIVITFTLAYATEQLGVARNVTLIGLLLAGIAEIVGILLFAYMADRIGRRPVALWSAAAVALLAYPYFFLVDTTVPVPIWLAMCVWTFAAGALYGITGVLIAHLFEARVRYSGISSGLPGSGCGRRSPRSPIATVLVSLAGGSSWLVATYLLAVSLVSLLSVYLASEKYQVEIYDRRPGDTRAVVGEGG